MQLLTILNTLGQIAPPRDAQPWDNVGLLAGDAAQEICRAMLCIDYTAAVAEEAKAAECELIIAYHPPLFKPISRITAAGPTQLLHDAVRRGVAIYSPHTALDVAEGGTNDVLAEAIGLVDTRPLVPVPGDPEKTVKLVTFAPADAIDAIADALFAAGAGRIGNYSACSFRSPGTGTFLGDESTTPAVGAAGRMERVDEIRLETVVPETKLAAVLTALRATHPYETPAVDLIPLAAPPHAIGIGRIGRPAQSVTRLQLIEDVKENVGVAHVLVAGPATGDAKTVAVCAGSCGEYLDAAIAAKVDVFVTGELKHHDALKAAAAGMTCVCTLHSHSERITLASLARRLQESLPTVQWNLSEADRDPFEVW